LLSLFFFDSLRLPFKLWFFLFFAPLVSLSPYAPRSLLLPFFPFTKFSNQFSRLTVSRWCFPRTLVKALEGLSLCFFLFLPIVFFYLRMLFFFLDWFSTPETVFSFLVSVASLTPRFSSFPFPRAFFFLYVGCPPRHRAAHVSVPVAGTFVLVFFVGLGFLPCSP